MNTECVFVAKTARTERKSLEDLAELIKKISDEIELYPVALARITTETPCYNTYDEAFGYATKHKKTTVSPGNLVLFVAGKYHYMSKQVIRRYIDQDGKKLLTDFEIVFPAAEEPFFEDLIEF